MDDVHPVQPSDPIDYATRLKPAHRTHGQIPRDVYAIWSNAKHRCNNKKSRAYPDYGGRGIQMCPEWENSFEVFRHDMGARPSRQHSLDRINNDGGYKPGNCRWATKREQQNNRRNNHLIVLGGERVTISEAARRTGICESTIWGRLQRGWPDEMAARRASSKRHVIAREPRSRCPQGHPLVAENTLINARGARVCRTCNREKSRLARLRRREAGGALEVTDLAAAYLASHSLDAAPSDQAGR